MLNDAYKICINAIRSCLPDMAVRNTLREYDLKGNIYLVAVGKAAFSMARAACEEVDIVKGIVISKYGHIQGDLRNIECFEASHPLPDHNSFKAAEKAIELVKDLGQDDIVLFLLSGGASSLFEVSDLQLDQLIDINDQMLRKGLNIYQTNIIRKKLSRIKGGKFADLCSPARVYSIILSDVLNDQLDVIGSGPTVKDSSSIDEAMQIIDEFRLELPDDALKIISNSRCAQATNAVNRVVGSVRILCQDAMKEAQKLGYDTILLSDSLDVDCIEAEKMIADNIRKHLNDKGRTALIAGGEITVNVKGNGLGGRNQQLILSLARDIKDMKNVLVMSLGSDGTDGPTDAAGAYADGDTCRRLLEMGVDYDEALNNNDAYHALDKIDALIKTGPTGTNVNDITVVLIRND